MIKNRMSFYIMACLVLVLLFVITGCRSEKIAETTEPAEISNNTAKEVVNQELDERESFKIKLRVIEFPPFYYQDENGQWTGLEVELAEALLKEAGLKAEYVSLPWSRALKSMEVGEAELMMNLVKTSDREEYMHFIGPERTSRMALVVNEQYKDESIDDVDDLFKVIEKNEIPIGLQKDVKYPPELAEIMENNTYSQNIDYTHATKSYPKNVINNRLFGFIEDEIAMKYQLSNNPDYKGLVLHSFAFSEEDVFIGISKHVDEDKYERLVSAFKVLESEGTFAKIIAKY